VGLGGRGEARTSRAQGGKQRSSSPPAHGYALLVIPVSSPRIPFRSFSFRENRAAIADIVVAFRGTVWAY